MESPNKTKTPPVVQEDENEALLVGVQTASQVFKTAASIEESEKVLEHKDGIIQSVNLAGAEVRVSSPSLYLNRADHDELL